MIAAAIGPLSYAPVHRVAAPASAAASAQASAPPPEFVIERAPNLSFVYIQVDSSTGDEMWRWPAAQLARASAKGAGAFLDISI